MTSPTGADGTQPDPWGLGADYRFIASGKVRDLYATPTGELLFIASDRVSAFDHVLPTTIPGKGRILTQMSLFWFDQLADIVPNHIVSTDVPAAVRGRAVVCRRLDMLPVECIARGYLTGSGYADYRATGAVCGWRLPAGLVDGSRLPEVLFTPATKAAVGDHDENIDLAAVAALIGPDLAHAVSRLTTSVYARAEEVARERGIIVADTKLEFGRDATGALVLADEVLTPDSSRFWLAESWQPGRAPQAFDKQLIRDWLASPAAGWDRAAGGPPPPLPPAVVEETQARYIAAHRRLTGSDPDLG